MILINYTDEFLKNNKYKIMLGSVGFILLCCIIYFIGGKDELSSKLFLMFLLPAAFLSVFYGIKFLFYIRDKFVPLNKYAGYIFDMLCLISALFIVIIFAYDFILTFDGFNLIIFSVTAAFLNAVAFSRTKRQKEQ